MNITVTYGKGFEPAPAPSQREKVLRLQAELSKLPQYQPETIHHFHGGMYCRAVRCEAGISLVGAVHKKEHFFYVASGVIRVTDDDGVQRMEGPAMLKSVAGTKRAIHTETDVVFMTFHRTDATDVEAAEIELVESDPASQYGVGNILKNLTKGALP